MIKVSPTPDDGLKRQGPESSISVDVDADLELRHFKAMLTLSSVAGMDLANPENARAVGRALAKAADLLSLAIREWHWLDRRGKKIEAAPADNPDAFDSLSMAEINWMLEVVSTLLKEGSVSEGT